MTWTTFENAATLRHGPSPNMSMIESLEEWDTFSKVLMGSDLSGVRKSQIELIYG